ncbi:MAG TPA: ABC-2 family transporter protein [Gemmataceae bacterium]|nr:ABC-2 family transporter protein [Gemmataceae bacterium]
MAAMRYVRLLTAFARFGLARELAFRGNFVIKVTVELLWLGILLVFYRTVFAKTSVVAGWAESEYLFFVGCYFAMESVIETLFLGNCVEFAELVRSGDLDIYLLKPIDEQFLLTCRDFDWSTVPSAVLGVAVMGMSLHEMHRPFVPLRLLAFVGLFACGVAIAYSFLLMLTASSIWLVRNQNLMEAWWLFTSLMRYPKEIFAVRLAAPLGWFFSFVVPILLVVNVPARVMVGVLDEPWMIGFTVAVAVGLLVLSRAFFRHALQRYRSASS